MKYCAVCHQSLPLAAKFKINMSNSACAKYCSEICRQKNESGITRRPIKDMSFIDEHEEELFPMDNDLGAALDDESGLYETYYSSGASDSGASSHSPSPILQGLSNDYSYHFSLGNEVGSSHDLGKIHSLSLSSSPLNDNTSGCASASGAGTSPFEISPSQSQSYPTNILPLTTVAASDVPLELGSPGFSLNYTGSSSNWSPASVSSCTNNNSNPNLPCSSSLRPTAPIRRTSVYIRSGSQLYSASPQSGELVCSSSYSQSHPRYMTMTSPRLAPVAHLNSLYHKNTSGVALVMPHCASNPSRT